MDQLQQEAARFEAAYRDARQASGPTKWPRFAEFLRDVYGGAVRDLAARQEERQRAAAQQAAQQAEHARLQAQQVRHACGFCWPAGLCVCRPEACCSQLGWVQLHR
jgi:hypothetical protein